MSDSIDKLKIDVVASSEDATDSLNSLISSLSNLNNVLGNIGKSGSKNGVQSLSNAFKGIQNSISGINTRKLTDAEKVLDSFEKKIADISKSTNKGFNLDGRLNREFENVGRAYREAIEKNTDEAWNNAMFKISELQDNLKHFGKVSNMDTKMPYVEELEAARRAQQKFYVEGAKYDDAFKGRMSKESLGKYGSLFTADKDKATMNITEWLEGIQRNGGELSAELAQSLAAPTDAFRTLAAEVSNFKDKYDNSLVKIDDESAVIPINAIYDAVDVADKAFRSANEQAQLFDNTLKTIGKDIEPASSLDALDKQIASAEKRQQSLLARKTKADALGDTDSKAYQKLALDIAEVTNQLEVLNQAKSRLTSTPVEADNIVKADAAKANIANLKQYLEDMFLSTEQIQEAMKRVTSADDTGIWYKDTAGTKHFTDDISTAAGELERFIMLKEQLKANGGTFAESNHPFTIDSASLSSFGVISNDVAELTAQLNYYKQVVADINSGAVKFDYEELEFAKRVIKEIALKANELGNEDLFASAMSDANSSASSLNEKLKQIKSNIIASGNENVLDKQIASAEKRLDSLLAKESKMGFAGEVDETSKSFVNLQYDIAEVCSALDILYAKKDQLEWLKNGYFPNSAESGEPEAERDVISFGEAVKNVFNGIKEKAGIVTSFYSSIGKAFGGIKDVVGKVATQIKGLGNSIMDVVKKIPLLGGIVNKIQGIGHRANQLGKRLVHMLGLMVIRRALHQMLSEVKNGLGALAAYSNSIGSPFNANISNMIASLRALGYQMTAAFEPIFNYIAPALDFLISKLATAINYITMFFNAITGGTTWTKATKTAGNYGASVGGAGKAAKDAAGAQKELNQQLMAWDKLNVITTPKDSGGSGGGGGGGGGGAGNLFEPVYTTENIDENVKAFVDKVKEAWRKGNFSEIGKIIGIKLKRALDKIPWKPIQKTSEKIGKSIGTLIGGFVSVPGLAKSIGTSIGQAVNTVLLGLNKFFTSTPWDRVGVFLAEGIGSALLAKDKIHNKTMVENFFTVIKNALNSTAEMVYNFARTFQWVDLGKSIASGIKNFLDRENGWDAYLAGSSLGALVSGIANTVYTVASDKKSWKNLGKKIADGINGIIDNTDWKAVIGSVGAIASGLLTAIRNAVKNIKWLELAKGIGKGIGEALRQMSVADWTTTLAIVGLPLLANALKNVIINGIGSSVSLGTLNVVFNSVKFIMNAAVNLTKGLVQALASALGVSASTISVAAGAVLAVTLWCYLSYKVMTDENSRKKLEEFTDAINPISPGTNSPYNTKNKAPKDITKDKGTEKDASDFMNNLFNEINKSKTNGSSGTVTNQVKLGGAPVVEVTGKITSTDRGKTLKTLYKTIDSNAQFTQGTDKLKTKSKTFNTTSQFTNATDKLKATAKIFNTTSRWTHAKDALTTSMKTFLTTSLFKKRTDGLTTSQKTFSTTSDFRSRYDNLGSANKTFSTVSDFRSRHDNLGSANKTFSTVSDFRSRHDNLGTSGKTFSTISDFRNYRNNIGRPAFGTISNFNGYRNNIGRPAFGTISNFNGYWNHIGYPAFGTIANMTDMWDNIPWYKKVINDVVANVSSIVGRLNPFRRAMGGVFYGGAWHSIEGYANGGYPTSAQLFMAREAGPELVGTIGSHTAVMNNGQIVDSVAAGVAQAVAGYINPILAEMGRENRYLAEIASKQFGVSSDDIFNASRAKGREYSMRTGQQAFVF